MIPGTVMFGRRLAAPPRVQLSDQAIVKTSTVHPVTASYSIMAGGSVSDQDGTLLEVWKLSGAATDYEVRATVTSGTLSSGTAGAWLSLGTSRTWSKTTSATATVNLLVEIRDAVTLAVLDTANISITADGS